jgi:hypothetical protein
MHRHPIRVTPVPAHDDLRPARQAKNITLAPAANHCGVWPRVISRIERGLQRLDQLANQHRDRLTAAQLPGLVRAMVTCRTTTGFR